MPNPPASVSRQPNIPLLLKLLLLLLGVLAIAKYLENTYARIILSNDGSVTPLFFYGSIAVYIAVIAPRLHRRFLKNVDNKDPALVVNALIVMVLMLLTLMPSYLVDKLPYDRDRSQSVDVTVKESRRIQSGGSAPTFHLETTSWRGLASERFRSNFNLFSRYQGGDRLTIKLGRDLFKRIRVVSIEKQ